MAPDSDYYRWRPHPWHGLEVGPQPPGLVTAYIEITPFDLVKYEVDKKTGYLRVDRPQLTSSSPPTLYGFIPRTYCGRRVGALAPGAERGDGDPMDICVISERPVERAEIILTANVIGGLQMIDANQADDKIVAVLQRDPVWGGIQDVSELPTALIERLRHYFLTYKMVPGQPSNVHIEKVYGREYAQQVVQASIDDYNEDFGQNVGIDIV
jgi:inorganic pyrophosphatase